MVIHFDFAENGSLRYQDAAMSTYWHQKQVSLFTIVKYAQDGTKSAVYLSDELRHSKETVTIYLEQLLMDFSEPSDVVHFISDGPASQFKNRFMVHYMRTLISKFALSSLHWNFSASGHGKGPVDGIGATIKRGVYSKIMARQALLNTVEDYYQVAKQVSEKISVSYLSKTKIIERYKTVEPEILNTPEVRTISVLHLYAVILYKSKFVFFRLKVSCLLIIGGVPLMMTKFN